MMDRSDNPSHHERMPVECLHFPRPGLKFNKQFFLQIGTVVDLMEVIHLICTVCTKINILKNKQKLYFKKITTLF